MYTAPDKLVFPLIDRWSAKLTFCLKNEEEQENETFSDALHKNTELCLLFSLLIIIHHIINYKPNRKA